MHINLLSADSPISPANAFAASRTLIPNFYGSLIHPYHVIFILTMWRIRDYLTRQYFTLDFSAPVHLISTNHCHLYHYRRHHHHCRHNHNHHDRLLHILLCIFSDESARTLRLQLLKTPLFHPDRHNKILSRKSVLEMRYYLFFETKISRRNTEYDYSNVLVEISPSRCFLRWILLVHE